MNLVAAPGLGSLMAGRIISGIAQLVLAVMGCGLFLVWFVLTLSRAYGLADFNAQPETISHAAWGEAGAVLFGVSWVWSLVTSIGILRQAKKADKEGPPPVPPRLPGPPSGPK